MQRRISSFIAEISGALGDLGTLLPYLIGILSAGLLLPGPVFAGLAAAYLTVAFVFRLPIPVQPMKAIGAVALAGGLGTLGIAWAGAILGALLILFALLPGIERHARAVPQSIIAGLQAGLGLTLGMLALGLMRENWLLALPALALLSLSFVWNRGPWALIVAAVAFGFAIFGAPQTTPLALPSAEDSLAATLFLGVLPQLPLTLLNAVILTAALSRSLYGPAAERVTERKLALTTGGLNLVLAPFGALPMCHGAGGVAAHHRFGARTMAAPLVMAGLCAAAALAGPSVLSILTAIPLPLVGALLAWAAVDLAFSRRLIDARPDCRPVIAVTAAGTVFFGAAIGFAAGLGAEGIRSHLARRRVGRV